MAEEARVIIPKVWRSEYKLICLFFVTSLLSVMITRKYPALLLSSQLGTIGSWSISLSLPVLGLIPAGVLLLALFRIYNVRYVLHGRGID